MSPPPSTTETALRPVASLKTARGHRPQARGHILYTPKKVVTESPSQPITVRGSGGAL